MNTSRKLLAVVFTVVSSCLTANAQLVLKENNIESIISAMTIEEKAHLVVGAALKGDDAMRAEVGYTSRIVPGSAGTTYPIKRLGIPPIVMADGPAGLRISPQRENDDNLYFCTGFPVGILLASTFDVGVVEKVGAAMGNEVLEYGVDVLLAPGVNMMRNPLCGRNFEYYSEDPVLAGLTAAAFIRGVQSNGVGTSLKHYAVNSQEINRLGNDARVAERTLREIYLRNFEIAVRNSQPWTVMTSYNYVNGLYTSEDRNLVDGTLRADFGFGGAVVSDWGGGLDAVAQVRAGNDMIQPGTAAQYNAIVEAVRHGRLSVSALDRSVRRILQLIVRTPRFKGYVYSSAPDLRAHAAVSRRAAADGMVLLKNEGGALPLYRGMRVALMGVGSYEYIAGGKGAGDVNKAYVVNLEAGLDSVGIVTDTIVSNIYRRHIVTEHQRIDPIQQGRKWFLYGFRPNEIMETSTFVNDAATRTDIGVITISRGASEGFDRHVERDFCLHHDEIDMILKSARAFHEQGKKVVVVLNICSPVEMTSWQDCVDAILVSWLPGGEGGAATADVLSGEVNPSGCLPVTFPRSYDDVPSRNFPRNVPETGRNQSFEHYNRNEKYYDIPNIDFTDYTEGIFIGYRHYVTRGIPTAYAFGFGLSYTDFTMSDMRVEEDEKYVTVSVRVRNSGDYAGRKVVQLYSSPAETVPSAPAMELRAYSKTPLLDPGQECTVSMRFLRQDLAYFSESDRAWILQDGKYDIHAGFSSDNLVQHASIIVEERKVRKVSRTLVPEGEPLFLGIE